MRQRGRIWGWALSLLGAVIALRLFVVEVCVVPSPSMEPTVLRDEVVVFSKLPYGPQLPRRWADVPIINAFTWIEPLRVADGRQQWRCRRLGGYRRPHVGDVIVFRAPDEDSRLVVKRVARIIPCGARLRVTKENHEAVRRTALRDHRHASLRRGRLYVDGKPADSYMLRQDFFFVEGDNAAASYDSRRFGLVPAENIVGKMGLVIYSWDRHAPLFHKTRWRRIFRSI